MTPAVLAHTGQVFQYTGSQLVYDLLQLGLELRAVQFLGTSGPPGVPELLSPVPKVHSDMANAAKPLVFLRRHGIEKARFIERSGPCCEF